MRGLAAAALLLLAMLAVADANLFTVEWAQRVNYTDWASGKRFFVGDWLKFVFTKYQYTVLEVNQTNYENCVEADFITNITRGGRDVFQLNDSRPYYFISGYGQCWGGVKLAINVENIPPPQSSPSKSAATGVKRQVSALSPFGMSHQQALAQVTAQAALAQSNMQNQAFNNQTLLVNPPGSYKPPSALEPEIASIVPSEVFHAGPKSQPPTAASDKPVDDGYNWRKYGQKQVKGSEYPRSYYKCTCFCCPVKKKVERSPEGQIIEIIYKGQHNHEQSLPKKSARDGNDPIENVRSQAMPDDNQLDRAEVPKRPTEAPPEQIVHEKDEKFLQETSVDSRPLSTDETRGNAHSENGPMLKKRNSGSAVGEPNLPQKTVVEPKIVVQTRSEVDLLDDGFRWRKYGQKAVKGNSHPRSYYKCTTSGCNVRKHVERASADPKSVITTYEGKHNHDMQKGRSNSRNISGGPPQPKSHPMR